METTLYFKDIRSKDQNDYTFKIYKVEYSRMLIEVKFHLRTREDNPIYRTEYRTHNRHLSLTEKNG